MFSLVKQNMLLWLVHLEEYLEMYWNVFSQVSTSGRIYLFGETVKIAVINSTD